MDVMPGFKHTDVGVIPEDWEVTSLASIGTFSKGQGIRKDEAENGNLPAVRYGELYTHHSDIIRSFNSRITRDVAKTSRKLRNGNLLFAGSGETKEEIGKCAAFVEDIEAYAGGDIIILSPNQGDSIFLGYLLNAPIVARQKASKGQGDAIVHISASALSSIKIPLPPTLAEQQAIAEALSDVDALIRALDRLIAKKRAIKQGAMQELLTGRRRLPGFGGEWEMRRLGDIVEKLVNGGTPSTQQPEYWAGHIPWITGADILDQQVSEIRRYITEEAVRNSSTNVVERGNLLLVSRTGVGKLAIAPFAVAISQDFTGVYARRDQILPQFLFHFLDYKPEVLRSQNQGTSIQGITRETLIAIPVPVPQLAEQTAIATVLSDMDAEITALEQRRDKTRLLKQGMMQELLTGRIRLIGTSAPTAA